MMNVKGSKDKILANGLIERISSILDEIPLKDHGERQKKVEVIERRKEDCTNFE